MKNKHHLSYITVRVEKSSSPIKRFALFSVVECPDHYIATPQTT